MTLPISLRHCGGMRSTESPLDDVTVTITVVQASETRCKGSNALCLWSLVVAQGQRMISAVVVGE